MLSLHARRPHGSLKVEHISSGKFSIIDGGLVLVVNSLQAQVHWKCSSTALKVSPSPWCHTCCLYIFDMHLAVLKKKNVHNKRWSWAAVMHFVASCWGLFKQWCDEFSCWRGICGALWTDIFKLSLSLSIPKPGGQMVVTPFQPCLKKPPSELPRLCNICALDSKFKKIVWLHRPTL